MRRPLQVGRRGFLGIGAAALAGAALGAAVGPRREDLRWADTEVFPDCPTHLLFDWPARGGVTEVRVELVVRTPTEELVVAVAEVPVSPGAQRVPVSLLYPYGGELREGAYEYRARVAGGPVLLETAEAATFSVRRVAWFG